jgi:Predicted membrane protein (DUF2079)
MTAGSSRTTDAATAAWPTADRSRTAGAGSPALPAAARIRRFWSRWRSQLRDAWPLELLCLLTFAVYGLVALQRHRQFGTAGYDLGIFDQAVRRYAHFEVPIVPLKGVGYNIFGDHFHPIIALAAPFYWIWDNPQTLLLVQAALIAASVPVVYRFARRRMSDRAALIVCIAYAAGWPFQALVNFNFHEVAWGVPILALAIDALDRADDRQLIVFAGLLLLVREDMGILVVLLGLLRAVRRPRVLRGGVAVGLGLVAVGIAAYEIATAVILPHFAPNGQFAYWQYTETLGPNLASAVRTVVVHPWHTVQLFFTPWTKTHTLLLLLIPLLFLCLRSRYAILALPLLAQRFFEPPARSTLWGPGFHYNALPWLILTLAMIDGGARLGVWSHRRIRIGSLALLLVVSVGVIAFQPNSAILHDLVTGDLFRTSDQMRAQQAVVDRVPRNVCVEADDRLAGHLTARDYVTLPPMQHFTADFLAVDLSQPDVGNYGPLPADVLADAEAAGYWIMYANGPLRLLQSPRYAGPSSECGPLGTGHTGAAG